MQTDILTRDERKLQIAAAVGTDHVAEVSLDIRRMRELGVLVDVDVHGTSMFTARATWNELGIPEEDTRRKRLKRGTKDLIPKVYIGRLRSLEARFRQSLDKHSFDVAGFRPYRWVPFTAYESWRGEWDRLQEELATLKAEILDQYDTFVDLIAADFGQIAREAWDAIRARRPAGSSDFVLVTGSGVFESEEAFVDYVVARAVAQLPSPERIETDLYVDYRNAMITTGADVVEEQARMEEARTRIELERVAQATAWEEERIRTRQMRMEMEEEETLSRMRLRAEQEKLAAMRQAELEHARQQIERMGSPFSDVVGQFRAQIYEAVGEIAASIRKNGHLRGRVAERARGLLDLYHLLGAAAGDADLEEALVELRSRLDHRPVDGGRYDTGAVESALSDIARLTHDAALDVARSASAHTRAGALMI
jgi:hypothetical protein